MPITLSGISILGLSNFNIVNSQHVTVSRVVSQRHAQMFDFSTLQIFKFPLYQIKPKENFFE